MRLTEFANRKYEILEILNNLADSNHCIYNISQSKICELSQYSKLTVNTTMVWLRDNEFIVYLPKRKGYMVTKRGLALIKNFNKTI